MSLLRRIVFIRWPTVASTRVAAEMAKAIVDLLEVIEVEHHDRERPMRAAGSPQFGVHKLNGSGGD